MARLSELRVSTPWCLRCGTFHFHYTPNPEARLRRVRIAVEAARMAAAFGGSPTLTPTGSETIDPEPQPLRTEPHVPASRG